MTFLEFQISHYTERIAQSKSDKEKQFLTDTLKGLKSNPNENFNPSSAPFNYSGCLSLHHYTGNSTGGTRTIQF